MRRALVLLSLGLLLASVATVGAHAKLVKSLPASDAVLTAAPTRLHLWFNEHIEARFSRITVVNARGQRVDTGDVAGDPAQPTLVTIGLAPMDPGRYTVQYRVLSIDSHVITQQFGFTIQPQP